jgi:glutamate/tyrosine decarboxylase-like PLP-dependent enzyme
MSPRAVFPAPRAGPPLLAPTGIGFAASSVTQSATVDAHKQIHLPTRTSLLVLGDPHDARAIEKSSDYIIRNGSDDLGQPSIESSRPGFAALPARGAQHHRPAWYETLVDDSVARAAFIAQEVDCRRNFEPLA